MRASNVREIPKAVADRFRSVEVCSNWGVFPEISYAWATIDNSLFLWRTDGYAMHTHPFVSAFVHQYVDQVGEIYVLAMTRLVKRAPPNNNNFFIIGRSQSRIFNFKEILTARL
jgi:hypothetical protein